MQRIKNVSLHFKNDPTCVCVCVCSFSTINFCAITDQLVWSHVHTREGDSFKNKGTCTCICNIALSYSNHFV